MNSKHYRKSGISCRSTASTTGTSTTSTFEWARAHTHPPDNNKIATKVTCPDVKKQAAMEPGPGSDFRGSMVLWQSLALVTKPQRL